MKENKKVLIGLSGGVDSSVATHILKEQGYDVAGISMITYKKELYPNIELHEKAEKISCFGHDTLGMADAEKVAKHFGIDFKVLDLSSDFKNIIIKYFISQYSEGRTPNPCIKCNRIMKFGLMLERARQAGLEFDYFATGHYARIEFDETKKVYLLKKASFLEKDQSYFLSYLPQEVLAKTLLPLGNYTKPEVRQIAEKLGLFNSNRTESQDFYTGDYNDIVNMNGKISCEGNIVDISGRVLGRHEGITNYTIGQRKRLGISADRPLYVVALDSEKNEVIVDYVEGLSRTSLTANDVNWSQGECYGQKFNADVKIRYRHNPVSATVTLLEENKVRIDFDEPVNAITPGQLACLYDGDTVIGSGWIE